MFSNQARQFFCTTLVVAESSQSKRFLPPQKMVIDMHFRFAFATALVLLASPAFVSAQTPGTGQSVKSGAWVFSTDGHRIGRVEDVADGMAAIIYNGHMIHIPLDKLAAGEKGLVSSLTRKEIDQL